MDGGDQTRMNNIESRVLEMKFDNEQFESAVATTMNTLDKFKEKLKFEDASKNIHKLGQATTNYQYTLQDVGTSLSNLERYFSSCGTLGSKIFDTLTTKAAGFVTNGIGKIVSSITQGGMSRAMNLEQAKFQLDGILKDAQLTHRVIYDDILPELQGTPYSLDQAAVVISQLASSGKTSSEQIKRATRGMAGLAAMSGHSLEEVGRIYTKVAGNGVLMAQELNQLSGYSINAAAALKDFYNMVEKNHELGTPQTIKDMKAIKEAYGEFTEETIREAASKRMIHYGSMAAAMDVLYGAHAQKSTEMYTGALEDLKAALARTGAEAAELRLSTLRDVFNSLVPAVDAVNAVINPFLKSTVRLYEGFEDVPEYLRPFKGSLAQDVQKLGWAFQGLFVQLDENHEIIRANMKTYEKLGFELRESATGVKTFWDDINKIEYDEKQALMNPAMLKTITSLTKSFVNVVAALGKSILSVGRGIRKALPKITLEQISNLAEHIENFTKALIPSADTLGKIQNAAQAAFTPISLLIRGAVTAVKLFGKALSALYKNIKPILESIKLVANSFSILIIRLGRAVTHIAAAISNFVKFGASIVSLIAKILHLNKIVSLIQDGFGGLASILDKLFIKIGNKALAFSIKLENISKYLKIDAIKAKVEALTGAVAGFFEVTLHLSELSAGFKEFWAPIKEFLDSHSLFDTIINGLKEVLDWIGQLIGKDTFVDRLSTSLDNLQASIGGFTAKPVEKIRKWLGDFGKSIADFLNSLDEAGYVSTWLKDNFKLFGFVYKLGKPIKQLIEPLGGSIISFIQAFTGIKGTGELVAKAGEWIKKGFEKIVSAVGLLLNGGTGEKIRSLSETLFNNSFAKNAEKIGKGFNLAIQPFADALSTLGNTISEHFNQLDPQTVKKVLVSLILLIVSISYLETLSNARKTIKGALIVLDKFAEIFKGISLFANAFKDAMLAFKGIAKAITGVAYILAIATALVIFAAAVKILSTVDTASLILGTVVLTLAMSAILFMFNRLNKIDFNAQGNKALKLAAALLSVGGAMMLMALAIKMIADVYKTNGLDDIVVAVVAIGAMMMFLAAFSNLASFKKIGDNINTLGWAFVGIGSGMKLMAEACQMLAKNMDADELDRGVSAISQILIMFSVFAAANWHHAALGKAAFGMVGIAVALALIARTMTYMTKNLDENQIKIVTKAIGEIVAFFAIFAFMVGLASKLGAGSVTAAAMVLSMALFMKVLGESMVMMASLIDGGKLDKVTEVIQSFLAIMAVISLISAVGGVNAAAGPVAIAALALALLGLAEAIYVLGTMPLGTVTLGFLRLGAALAGLVLTLVVAGVAFKAFLEALDLEDAGVLFGIGAGMLFMAMTIRILAELPIDALKVAFTGFIGILLATGLVLLAFSNPAISTGLLLVGAAFALVGAAALFVGAGLMLVTLALSALIPLIIALGGADTDRLAAGLNVLGMAAEGLKEVFYRIADGVMYFGLAVTVTAVGLVLFAVGIAAVGIALVIATVGVLALAGAFAVLASVLDAFVPQIKDSVLGTLGTLIGKVGEFFGSLREEKGRLERDIEQSTSDTDKKMGEAINGTTRKLEDGKADVKKAANDMVTNPEVNDTSKEQGMDYGEFLKGGMLESLSTGSPEIQSGLTDMFGGVDVNNIVADSSLGDIGSIAGPLMGSSLTSHVADVIPGGEALAQGGITGAESVITDYSGPAEEGAEAYGEALEESTAPSDGGKTMAKNSVSAANGVVTNDRSGFKPVGTNAAKGFANGMSSAIETYVTPAARRMATRAKEAAMSALGEHSPSRVFMRIGEYVSEGFAIGITSMEGVVEKSSKEMANISIGAAKMAAAAIDSASLIEELNPTITPVVDLTNVDQSVAQMGAMFNTAFGVATPYGAMNAAFAAQSFADSRNQNERNSELIKLVNSINSMTDTMNSRSLNNYINIDGAGDPEAFADGLIRSFRLNARTV